MQDGSADFTGSGFSDTFGSAAGVFPVADNLSSMNKAFIVALPDEVGHVAEIHGHPVFFCGVGKVNASIGIQELMRSGYSDVVNIGSCGSAKHALGEIVHIGKVHQDIDCSPICSYGHTAFEDDSHTIILDPSSPHSCFTTDYFYDRQQSSKYSTPYLEMIRNSSVFDMELYAMAKTCRRYGISLSSYKWVSDDGDHSTWMENCLISSGRVIDMLFPG